MGRELFKAFLGVLRAFAREMLFFVFFVRFVVQKDLQLNAPPQLDPCPAVQP